MNILYYCAEYPPAITGGIGTVTKILAEELVRQGHNVYVIGLYSAFEHYLPQRSTINGVHVYRYFEKKEIWGNGKIGRKLTTLITLLGLRDKRNQNECSFIENEISRLCQEQHIDIIELTDYYSFIAKARRPLTFKKFTIPTIVRAHGSVSFLSYFKKHPRKREIENDIRHLQRTDAVCAVSQTAANFVNKHLNVPADKITVIPNALENSFYEQTALTAETNDTILFIGKIRESKGAFSTIQAFSQLADKYPCLRLKLIGGGNLRQARQRIPRHLQEKITFTGFLNREQVIQEIDACLFACIPSHFETFGMVAIEIMARKKAIIFTNTTAGEEIITDGVNGLLVSPFDTTAIAQKMEFLLQHPEERERIESNAYLSTHQYNIKNISKRLLDFYRTNIETYRHS